MKPALTAEEWGKQHAERPALEVDWSGDRVVDIGNNAWDTTSGHEGGDRHAIAAACLYGQPFGFTWEDVRILRGWAETEAEFDVSLGERPCDRMANLADRIAALLPPEVA